MVNQYAWLLWLYQNKPRLYEGLVKINPELRNILQALL